MARGRRLAAVLGVAALAVAVVPAVVWSSLPARLAVHWTTQGEPDRFLGQFPAWMVTGGVTVLFIVLTGLLYRAGQRHRLLSGAVALSLFLSAVFAAATVVVMWANAGASAPPEVTPLVPAPIVAAGSRQ